ncbi:putative mitochondrial protein [Tanacetum coccineum]
MRRRSIFEDPVSALKNAKYDKFAKEYQDLFDTLLCRVTISQEHAISLYLGGLPAELEMSVRMFKPATLADAYSLTRTLRVRGTVGKHTIHILVDCGSTHNFVDVAVAKKLGCPIRSICPLSITIGMAMRSLSLMRMKEISEELQPELQDAVEEFADVFVVPKELPLSRTCDHRIPLLEGTNPINIRPYSYPLTQKEAIESMRMYVDYRQLNNSTIKDKFPIPIIEELINELHGSQIFSKLDLRSRYHQIRMHEEDVAKTAFKTHQGHYEFPMMPFGLTNAPSTFRALMNEVFNPFLRKFTLVLFDEILIYSKSLQDHVEHLRHVEYLGHVISDIGVATNPSKIKAMENWPLPTNVKQLRGFLRLICAPGLALPDFEKEFTVETNASGVGIRAVLIQGGHPIAYLSKTLSSKHQLMSTYEKEFLDVILALERWRGLLLQLDYEIQFKKGVENVSVDALSRIQSEAQLFSLFSNTPIDTELLHKIEATWEEDNELKVMIQKLKQGDNVKNSYAWTN